LEDQAFWQHRRCLLEPVDEIAEAEHLLDKAADAHLAGQRDSAAKLIAAADMPRIRQWTESIWGRYDQAILRVRKDPSAPACVPLANRPKPRAPNALLRRRLVERDGHRCRFCGIAVINRSIRVLLRGTYPEALPWGRRNSEQHAALQCMWLQYDHVMPNGRGGESSFDNMVVTCAPCNFGRMERTLLEVGVLPPAPPSKSHWDGLSRLRPLSRAAMR